MSVLVPCKANSRFGDCFLLLCIFIRYLYYLVYSFTTTTFQIHPRSPFQERRKLLLPLKLSDQLRKAELAVQSHYEACQIKGRDSDIKNKKISPISQLVVKCHSSLVLPPLEIHHGFDK